MQDATPVRPQRRCIAAVDAALRRLASLIESTDALTYRQSIPERHIASIGEHARHIIDMAKALHTGCHSGTVDYSARKRGSLLEQRRDLALAEVFRLRLALLDLHDVASFKELEIRQDVEFSADPVLHAVSTFDREAMFVASHTVHHLAMMGVIARELGVAIAANEGLAPGTRLARLCSADSDARPRGDA